MKIQVVTLIVVVILAYLSSLKAQEVVIFSELNSKAAILKETDEISETYLDLELDTFIDRADLTIRIANEFEQYFDTYDFNNYLTSISVDKKFKKISNFSSICYENSSNDTLKLLKLYSSIYRISQSDETSFEYGLNFELLKRLNSTDFNILSCGFELGKKNHFKSISLHQIFDFNLNQLKFENKTSELLYNLKYDLNLSTSLHRNVGIAFNLGLNFNLNSTDKIFFPTEKLYNNLCYQEQKFLIKLKIFVQNLMLNPYISITRRTYLNVAVYEEFDELNLNCGFYADYILDNGLLIYCESDYSSINDDLSRIDIFSFGSGLKFQFDIYTR